MLRSLLDCTDHEQLLEALEKTPDSLNKLYKDVLVKIPKQQREKARLMFIWLCYSLRPLTLRELACAVNLPDPQDVLVICTSYLVSLQQQDHRVWNPSREHNTLDDIVKFDHFSVKEYLTSNRLLASPETSYFHANPLMAHLAIADISVSHIIKTSVYEFATAGFDQKTWSEFPLLDYSTRWYKHLKQADAIETSSPESEKAGFKTQPGADQPDSEALRVHCHRLFRKEFSQSYQNWLSLEWEKNWSRKYLHYFFDWAPMIVACLMNLRDNVRRLLENGAKVDGEWKEANLDAASSFASYGKSTKPILAAVLPGNLETLRLLLEKGATLSQSELDKVAEVTSRYGVDVLTTILKSRPSLGITDGTRIASTKNKSSKELLIYFLDKENQLTKSQLEVIVKNYSQSGWEKNSDVIDKIIDYGMTIHCDKTQMLKAFLRWSDCGPITNHLIDRYDPHFSMALEILGWVFEDWEYGLFKLQYVLDHCQVHGVEVMFTPDVKEARVRLPRIGGEEGREHRLTVMCRPYRSDLKGRILKEKEGMDEERRYA